MGHSIEGSTNSVIRNTSGRAVVPDMSLRQAVSTFDFTPPVF